MAKLSDDAWAQVRHDYEHTDRTIPDICLEHGISSGTLRDRVRRGKWTPRRVPIAPDGPPPLPAPSPVLPPQDAPGVAASETAAVASAPHAEAWTDPAGDTPLGTRLQAALARVVPAIEATLARLGAGPVHRRDVERSARDLAALTRTLRELSALASQHPAPPDRGPDDPDAFVLELTRRMDAFAARHAAEAALATEDAVSGTARNDGSD